MTSDKLFACSNEDVEQQHLMTWVRLSTEAKIDWFEEMIEIAYASGALATERLAWRDANAPTAAPQDPGKQGAAT